MKTKQLKVSNEQGWALGRLGVIFLERGWGDSPEKEVGRYVDLRSASRFLERWAGYPSGGGPYTKYCKLKPEYEQVAAHTALLLRLADPNFGANIPASWQHQ